MQPVPIGNRLLDRLSATHQKHVLRASEYVELAFGQVIQEPNAPIRHVYFPTAGVISSMLRVDAGHFIEVSITGSEGLHNVAAARGRGMSNVRAEVHAAGSAWRMGVAAFRRALLSDSALLQVVDGYMDTLLAGLVQAAGCNRFHHVEQRVARWLLMTADRMHSPVFAMTHQLLAHTLGVRRVGVTNAAGALQRQKLIAYARGVVAIIDRPGLERASCSCYHQALGTYAQAFPEPPPADKARARSTAR